MPGRASVDQVRAALNSPIPSIRPPFRRDGAIDYRGLNRLVDFCLDAGAQALLLTWGDSHFSVLTDEEVPALTEAVVRRARGRALVVAADRQWWTGKAVAHAKACRDLGADVVMVFPPDWGGSGTEETHVRHYAAVARIMPVMLLTAAYFPRGAGYALKVIEQVRDRVPGVVAVKDDMCGDFAHRLCLAVHDRWAIFAGGQKQNHLNMLPWGVDGYLSTFITFTPRIAWRYWRAVEAGDWAEARAVIREVDMPFFEHILGLPGGFDAAMHAILEIAGHGPRWRRPPYRSFTDAEVEQLRAFLRERAMID